MSEQVFISIQTIQSIDTDEEIIKMDTVGFYSVEELTHILCYDETLEKGGCARNKLTITPQMMRLRRCIGGKMIKMDFMQGETTETNYVTPIGVLPMQIKTIEYQLMLSERYNRLHIVYELFFNGTPVSTNRMSLEWK